MSAELNGDATRAALAEGWKCLPREAARARGIADSVLAATAGHADALLLRAAAARRQGDPAGAHADLAPLMKSAPASPIPWFEWGMVLSAMGQDDQAVHALRQAVHLAPGFTAAWRALGDVLLVQGAGPPAGEAYAHAARAANQNARLAAAALALCNNQAGAAAAILRAHVGRHPDDAGALHLLAEAQTRVGDLAAAEQSLGRCLHIAPTLAEARHALAVLLYVQRKFGAAGREFLHLLSLAPHQASLRVLLSVCLIETGDFAGAIPHHEALLAAYRAQPKIWLIYAHALKTLGRETEAIAAYRTCIELAPDWAAGAYLSLADVKTSRFSDSDIQAMQTALRRAAAHSFDAAQLHYALGRALEQREDWAASFAHFASGARIRRTAIAYDADATTAFVARSRAVFNESFFAARGTTGCRSREPIFIVGMPRSGSTLVEQILASHSAIEGTAELEVIGAIARELRGDHGIASLPGIVAGLDAATLTRLGERYVDETRQHRHAGKPHFIDKMPDNFLYAGLIHLMLPNARFIDVRRGAMAAGWAAYKQFFQAKQTSHDYTYDLTEIARYRRDYVALMAHWHSVMPGRIHLVRYEQLVEDTEAEIRALLGFCGLEMEPACLRFWETSRAVQTPSAQQVRRPIFREGLDAWRHYEAFLAPLRDLGPTASEPEI